MESILAIKKYILESLNELGFQKEGLLNWMFGRWCGGLDDHGSDYNRELDHDRDHYLDPDGFHEMFGRSNFV
jgi:hypothetical protein